MSQSSKTRIAVLVDTSSAWGRRLISGVLSYAKIHGPWEIYLEPRGQTETFRLPKDWNGDGVIARISSKSLAEHLQKQQVPVINVSGIRIPGVDFPRVCTDNYSFACLAVSHFAERGIQNVAYVGLHGRDYSIDRQQQVSRAAAEADMQFHVYNPKKAPKSKTAGRCERDSLGAWLKELPKPVGVLAWGVRRGSDVIEEANHHNLMIPEDIAVLGDDDDLLCEAVQPSLSGVVVPSEQIGLKAALMLDQLLLGDVLVEKELALEPTGIVSRVSTDVLAIDDEIVADALRMIRGRANASLSVQEVADTLAVSRRSLERRFKESLRRTVREEIASVHLERAKLLMGTTKKPVPEVARASGYSSPEYMATVFKRRTGLTPRQYRQQCQGQ